MKWDESMFEQNTEEVRVEASTMASLLVDEAEAFVAAHPASGFLVDEIVNERMEMMLTALEQRINQQLTVRGHITE